MKIKHLEKDYQRNAWYQRSQAQLVGNKLLRRQLKRQIANGQPARTPTWLAQAMRNA